MNSATVKQYVEEFRKRNACDSVEDSFPAWYLHTKYGKTDSFAIQNTSEYSEYKSLKGYDYGIDAFEIMIDSDKPKLVLIQAKYSTNLNLLSKGYKDLKRSIPIVASILKKQDSPVTLQNRVIVNLRAAINKLDSEVISSFQIDFVVIHLADEDSVVIAAKTESARNELKEAIEDGFTEYTSYIYNEGPRDWKETDIVPRAEWINIKLKGYTNTEQTDNFSNKMYLGLGYLSDLVELYNLRRDDLFLKNVRFFIKKKTNIERGPSGKMRETLKNICVHKKSQPELFAFYPNGITIYGKGIIEKDGVVSIREPYVLNGCQTIKTSFLFKYDNRLKNHIDENTWGKITIPLRIVTSSSEDLIRQITINNNRQNAISPASLRANDVVQIELEDRFRARKILYERQEGAKANLEDTHPELFEKYYNNSNNLQVNIVDIARSIAAVSGLISAALSPNHIFENDSMYEKVFSPENLRSIKLLVFLQNLRTILPVILKNDLNLNNNNYGITPTRLVFYTIFLLARYFEKSKNLELITNYGDSLVGKNKYFRQDVTSILGNHKSKIKSLLNNHFLSLDNSKTESLMAAAQFAAKEFRSNNNIFDLAANLDYEFEEVYA